MTWAAGGQFGGSEGVSRVVHRHLRPSITTPFQEKYFQKYPS
jgi:hypothetical protein